MKIKRLTHKICSVQFSVVDGVITAFDGGTPQRYPHLPCADEDAFIRSCDFIFQFLW